jgi:hypothetical protein
MPHSIAPLELKLLNTQLQYAAPTFVCLNSLPFVTNCEQRILSNSIGGESLYGGRARPYDSGSARRALPHFVALQGRWVNSSNSMVVLKRCDLPSQRQHPLLIKSIHTGKIPLNGVDGSLPAARQTIESPYLAGTDLLPTDSFWLKPDQSLAFTSSNPRYRPILSARSSRSLRHR